MWLWKSPVESNFNEEISPVIGNENIESTVVIPTNAIDITELIEEEFYKTHLDK